MNQSDFRHAVPPVPEHFLRTLEQTLLTIQQKEENDMNQSGKIFLTVVIALIAVLALTVGAIAATQSFGILDFFHRNGSAPLEGAEAAIQTELGSVETDLFTAAVEEAYFDGHAFAITVHYTAAHPEEDVLVDMLGGYWNDARFTTSAVSSGSDQNGTAYETTHQDGKRLLSALIPDFAMNGVLCGDSIEVVYQPDESLIYMLEGTLPDTIDVPASCTLSCGAVPFDSDESFVWEDIAFTLNRTPPEDSVSFRPAADAANWSIESATLTRSRLYTRLEVLCLLPPSISSGDYDIQLFDEHGNPIESTDGIRESANLEDGSYRNRYTLSLPSLQKISDTLVLCAKKVGSNEWLDPIQCHAEQN